MEKISLLKIAFIATMCAAAPAMAAIKNFEENVDNWKVYYLVGVLDSSQTPPAFNSNVLVIQGTGVAAAAPGCTTLSFDESASIDDVRMFLSQYYVAKASGLKMRIFMNDISCAIIRFGAN